MRHVNWGGYDASGSELVGTTSDLPSSFDNPNTRDYDWEAGRPYRLRISREDEGWAGWVDDTLVRRLEVPGDVLAGPMTWSEVFADCDHPTVRVRWSELEVMIRSGDRLPVHAAVASYQRHSDGGCDNTSSEVDGNAFVQMTNAPRRTSPGSVLRLG
jgi:hypothetical protein